MHVGWGVHHIQKRGAIIFPTWWQSHVHCFLEGLLDKISLLCTQLITCYAFGIKCDVRAMRNKQIDKCELPMGLVNKV